MPLIGIALVVLACSRERGTLRIGVPQLVLAVLGIGFLLALAQQYAMTLLAR
ncbi:hypothetical protein ACT3SQ_04370 [Brachybacterium sp. AOP42-C2-15]|uniref:hypothetical protein n=1 Tax=unclassified Brachybacterium TaxID=2623841 RepID=UPI004034A01E